MIRLSQFFRLWYISWILVRHGLDEIILATHLFRPIRFLIYLAPWYWLRSNKVPRGVRIRRALEDLGPIFVKFGQMLSTRRDLLPDDIAQELTLLQDRVPPFPGSQARQLIDKAYGQPLSDIYEAFDEKPLASASVAQVHTARLRGGREVVIKVLRPGIEKIIRRDVGLLYSIAELADRYWGDGKRLRPREVVREYEKTIMDELDLMREAANASQLRRNFEDSDELHVPEVYWPHTRRTVMVMERVFGTPISDIEVLKSRGVDLQKLSALGVEIFFTQVFRHNFFHADMHPGNIFVSDEGNYIAVDFGIMGSLSPSDQRYLAENFIAFFRRDYHRVAELHVESEWVPRGTRVDEFEAAIRAVCEPIFEKPLKEISFGQLLLRLFQTARRFNMEVQPQLVLLQKTLLNIEGLGRDLNPDLDLWQTAKPFLEDWMQEQVGAKALLRGLKKNLPLWGESLPELPGLVHEFMKQATSGRLSIDHQSRQLEALQTEVRRANNRNVQAIAGAALIVSSSLLVSPAIAAGLGQLALVAAGGGALMIAIAWLRSR